MSSKKKQKRTIEKVTAKRDDLKKELAAVRGKLTTAEKKLTKVSDRADRYKDEAKAQRTAAARAEAKVEKLTKKLERTSTAPMSAVTALPVENEDVIQDGNTIEDVIEDGNTIEDVIQNGDVIEDVIQPVDQGDGSVPDESWTVVQLRAEARTRGLVGMSKKSKAELLSALS